jgi:flagellar basal-body rod protein FlgF
MVVGRNMDVLANNLANMSTTGYKGEQAIFQAYLKAGPDGQKVAYVKTIETIRDLKQGDLTPTGNTLDTGIDGNGYFAVSTANGTQYTRNGRFSLNAQRQLVSLAGDPVLDDRGAPITIPVGSGRITITESGTIDTDVGPIAKLGLSSFTNPQQLTSTSAGLFSTTTPPTPDTTSKIHQGVIESSNIQPIIAMTQLLKLQGAYGDTQNVLQTEDTRLKNAVDKLSKVA